MYKLENNVEWTDDLKNAFKHGVTKAKIIYDKIEETSSTGESITLNGTTELNFAQNPIPIGNAIQENTPSFSNPSEIKTVTGNTEVKIQNKNLLKIENLTERNINGVTLSINDGIISLNGTVTSGFSFNGVGEFKQEVNQNYSWTFIYESGSCTDYGAGVYFSDRNGGVTNVGGGAGFRSSESRTATINSTQTTRNLYLYLHCNRGTVFTNYKIKFQIVKGTTADYNYKKYQEQIYPLTLGSIELVKIEDYQDTFKKENGTWKIPHKILKINSYNGEIIETPYISTTGGLDLGATVYYVGENDLEITNTTLISQLENILESHSYEGQTNISGESDGINPIFNVAAYTSEETEINYDNGLKEITLEDNVYVPDLGFIGQAVAKKATLTLIDNQQITNLENKEFELYIGADYNNQTYYINYGNFIVNEVPENDSTNGTIKIVAYDYMIKFNHDYEDNIVYPCTLKQYLINICSQAGVELGSQTFLNDSFLVTDNQFEGKQLRDILKHIGKCAFSWVRIGQDNKLYLDFNPIDDATEVFTIDEYKLNGYKKANEYYGAINKVTYGDSDITGQEESVQDDNDILLHGVKEIVINDNYFGFTTAKRHELIQAGTNLFGFTYMPVSQLDLTGAIYLDCTDIIEVQDEENNSITTRVFSHTIKYNGAVSDIVQAEAISDNQKTYENANTPAQTATRTEISVDRANQRIQSIASQIGDRSQKTTTITQDIDRIESTVQDYEDLTKNVTGIKSVTITDAYPDEYPLEIHIYGNNTVFDYLYPEDDLYPEDNLYPYGDSRIRFYNSEEDTIIDLGILEVLRANTETRDEIFVDYNGIVSLIRRINPSGTTKTTPEITQLGELHLKLIEGSNTFEIVNYSAPIDIKYVIKSTLTDIFATNVEMSSSITQTAEEINLEVRRQVSGKVGVEEVISRINQSAERISIEAEKIDINGTISANGNFKISESGDLYCNNAQLSGYIKNGGDPFFGYEGSIIEKNGAIRCMVIDVYNKPGGHSNIGGIRVLPNSNDTYNSNTRVQILNDQIAFQNQSNYNSYIFSLGVYADGITPFISGEKTQLHIDNGLISVKNGAILLNDGELNVGHINASGYGYFGDYVRATNFINGSEEKLKENICKFEESSKKKNETKKSIDILKNTDIYEYNFKGQKHKQIGVIIGEKYNTPEEIINEDEEGKKGIDLYSMISLSWKAIQEQQEQIEQLQKEIKELKGEK